MVSRQLARRNRKKTYDMDLEGSIWGIAEVAGLTTRHSGPSKELELLLARRGVTSGRAAIEGEVGCEDADC